MEKVKDCSAIYAEWRDEILFNSSFLVSIIISRLKLSSEKSPIISIARSSVDGRLYWTGSPSLAPIIHIINSSPGESSNLSLAILNFLTNGL
jgi:hypothetical protein